VTRYTYDARGMLTGWAHEGSEWRYQYDPFGRRVSKECDGRKRVFYWDRDRLAAEMSPRAE